MNGYTCQCNNLIDDNLKSQNIIKINFDAWKLRVFTFTALKNYAKFNHKISEGLTKRNNYAINTYYVCLTEYCDKLPLLRKM